MNYKIKRDTTGRKMVVIDKDFIEKIRKSIDIFGLKEMMNATGLSRSIIYKYMDGNRKFAFLNNYRKINEYLKGESFLFEKINKIECKIDKLIKHLGIKV